MDHKTAIARLEALKTKTQQDKTLSKGERDQGVKIIEPFIRGREMLSRGEDYLDNGYYFGYLMLQSQRIETAIKPILRLLEENQAQRNFREVREVDLEVSLGILIKKLKQYIDGSTYFSKLDEFKQFRNDIMHKLYHDHSMSLLEIEDSIVENYDVEAINSLHEMILRTTLRLGLNFPGKSVLKDFLDGEGEGIEITIL
jgi:hypothetical protein